MDKQTLAQELNTNIGQIEDWMLDCDIDPGLDELTDEIVAAVRRKAGEMNPQQQPRSLPGTSEPTSFSESSPDPEQETNGHLTQGDGSKLTSPQVANSISNGVPIQQAEAVAFKGSSKADYLFMVEQHAFLSRYAELHQQGSDAFVLDQAEQLQNMWSTSPDEYRQKVGVSDPNETLFKAHTSTALEILKSAVAVGKATQAQNLKK